MIRDTEIVIEVDGSIFSGWESATVDHSLDEISQTFSFSVISSDPALANSINMGAACSVYILEPARVKKYDLLSGYIDRFSRSITADGEQVQIEGRDQISDLVDCSAVVKASSWVRQKFSRICADLADGFEVRIDTSALSSDPIIEGFVIQNGETPFAAIERLCRSQGVLPVSVMGDTLATRYAAAAGNVAAQGLVVGDNVISIEWGRDWQGRFSDYSGKCSTGGKGKKWTAKNVRVVSSASDPQVERYRPMVFMAENRQERLTLETRVNWEAQIRAGRSEEITVEVADFFQKAPDGTIIKPWEINERVNVVVDRWNMEKQFLICGRTFTISEQGRRTRLRLRHPDTYKADPLEVVKLS